MNIKPTKLFFLIVAFFALLAALYHVAAFVQVIDNSPSWRHSVFIGISTICIYGLIKRPKWFIWFFGILMVQQLYSHGSHLLMLLKENKFNLVDAAIVFIMPLVFILLLREQKTG